MRVLLTTVPAALLAVSLQGQQQQTPPPYQTVVCVKLQSGKTGAEFRQFVSDTTMKLNQARVDAGEIISWSFIRSLMPMGAEARCDYVFSTLSEGPPAPPTTARLTEGLKKAAVAMTAEDYVAKRDSLTRLISVELWRPLVRVGQPQKGNYLFLNQMRVHDAAEYHKFENTVWKPMAEEWVKSGAMTAWIYGVKQLPGGTDVKYPRYSVDVFPSSDAALKGLSPNLPTMFAKVHPGQKVEETMERLSKLRSLGERQFLFIEDRVSKK
jgi:hypothetical protein